MRGVLMDNCREKFPVFGSYGILFTGFAVLLALNWPGQMSYDFVVQLAEGRSGQYDSWHPPVMAWLLGLFDSLLPGTGLYLVFTSLLLLGGWLVMMRQGRPGLGTALLLLLIFATPQLILYQGTVWKDVLFADAGIAGFACLAASASRWQNPAARLTCVILAAMLLSLAGLARQNGFLLLPVAALCLGLVAAGAESRSAGWRYGLGLLAAGLVLAGMGNLGLSIRSDKGEGAAEQIRLAQVYDLVGAAHYDPAVRFKLLERQAPRLNAAIRKDGVALYSPHLVDTLENSSTLTGAIHDAPPDVIFAQWRDLILQHPVLYLRQRLPVFGWLVAPPDPLLCHPDVVGVDGPPDLLRQLSSETADPAPGPRPVFLCRPILPHACPVPLAVWRPGLGLFDTARLAGITGRPCGGGAAGGRACLHRQLFRHLHRLRLSLSLLSGFGGDDRGVAAILGRCNLQGKARLSTQFRLAIRDRVRLIRWAF